MPKLTTEKYICSSCREKKNLVIIRNSAYLCSKCYQAKLVKQSALRELNKIANKILRG